jgi:hypothetical protein
MLLIIETYPNCGDKTGAAINPIPIPIERAEMTVNVMIIMSRLVFNEHTDIRDHLLSYG